MVPGTETSSTRDHKRRYPAINEKASDISFFFAPFSSLSVRLVTATPAKKGSIKANSIHRIKLTIPGVMFTYPSFLLFKLSYKEF